MSEWAPPRLPNCAAGCKALWLGEARQRSGAHCHRGLGRRQCRLRAQRLPAAGGPRQGTRRRVISAYGTLSRASSCACWCVFGTDTSGQRGRSSGAVNHSTISASRLIRPWANLLLLRGPQVHPDFQFAIGDVVLRLPEAAAAPPGAATSAAAPATAPAASAGDTPAATQPPDAVAVAAGAAEPPPTAAAAVAAALAADTEPAAAAGVAAEAGASAAPQAAGISAQQRPAPKTRAAQRAEWTEVHISKRNASKHRSLMGMMGCMGSFTPAAAAVLRRRWDTRKSGNPHRYGTQGPCMPSAADCIRPEPAGRVH